MDQILSAAVAYAQAKVDESHALKSGTPAQYGAAVKRSDIIFEELRTAVSQAADEIERLQDLVSQTDAYHLDCPACGQKIDVIPEPKS